MEHSIEHSMEHSMDHSWRQLELVHQLLPHEDFEVSATRPTVPVVRDVAAVHNLTWCDTHVYSYAIYSYGLYRYGRRT